MAFLGVEGDIIPIPESNGNSIDTGDIAGILIFSSDKRSFTSGEWTLTIDNNYTYEDVCQMIENNE